MAMWHLYLLVTEPGTDIVRLSLTSAVLSEFSQRKHPRTLAVVSLKTTCNRIIYNVPAQL